MRKTFLILLLFTALIPSFSQVTQSNYIDVGSNNMSSGVFGRLTSITGYRTINYEARVGLQTTFSGADRNIFSGVFIDVAGDYSIKNFPLNVSLFFRHNPYSSLVSETNFGLIARHNSNHFELQLGYDSRIYSMKKGETDLSDLPDPDLKIYEWRNFMYKGTIWLRPRATIPEQRWNVAASLTNFDHFLIQQETNPMLTALFLYDLNSDWRLYSEFWYQGAGMLNLSANYYGFYFRAGFRWQLN